MNNKIIVDFSTFAFCFRTINIKSIGFTNKLKNEQEFYLKFKILFEDLLPSINNSTFEQLQFGYHSHQIKYEEKDKIMIIKKIVSELVKTLRPGIDSEEFIKQNIEGEIIWQIGNKGIRLYGIRNKNIFKVLFIDYHHLIYPSLKYNDYDYKYYNFGIIEAYEGVFTK